MIVLKNLQTKSLGYRAGYWWGASIRAFAPFCWFLLSTSH